MFVVINFSVSCHCFINVYPKLKTYPVTGDPGEPLILTPLIEAGKIEQARSQSYVKPIKDGIVSYSGFFTVNKQYNSNLFFWFFPAQNNNETAPVVVWLQGGPGATSLFGLFTENGPFYIKKKHGLKLRKYTWISNHNVIYIDNPVGTGFSFTGDDKGYSTSEMDVGNNLYEAVVQFFQLFPQYQKKDFFVTGESYAGKYVPALSYTIHTKNPAAKLKINLKGVAIGNGLCDPEHMLHYGDYLYQIGLIDINGRDVFNKRQTDIVSYIQQKDWIKAFSGFDELLNGDLSEHPSLFYNLTGFTFYFNYLHSKDDSVFGDMNSFVQTEQFRKAIHVGNATFHTDTKVEEFLKADVMQSVKPWVETLLENYRVLIYNGQLDIIVAYPMTLGFLQSLNWTGADAYKTATRKPWYVRKELAGYSKTVKNFTEVLVRDAGHMVPMDQPLWALDLITRFTQNKPF